MDNFDLNIDNYDLEDLLNLFHLNYEFDENDLKRAKTLALKTHPDKSGLPKEVFLFFMKAYKMIESIYEFKMKRAKCARNTSYENEKMESDKKALLLKKLDGMKAKDFNKWFNDMFEKVKVNDDDVDSGYGKWFKSNEDVNEETVTNKRDMEAAFNRKKAASRELVLHKGVNEMVGGGGYDLTRSKPDEYSSDIFSKLQYDDLRKAHTETVVPVTHEDYLRKKKYSSVDSLRKDREANNPGMLSLQQSKELLRGRKSKEQMGNTQRAFKILKREEEISRANKDWWKELRTLKN
tara:strand:+ start:212 stop:1090 length:879 start_codon:yes stop_codon:yes gene_type:complete